METTTLRFRDAQTWVRDGVTIIKGELLDMEKIAQMVAPVLASDENFIAELAEAIGESNYVDFTITWLDRLSPEQLETIMDWLNEDNDDSE